MATNDDDARNWRALGDAVRDRRKTLGWRQGDVPAHGGPSEATVRNVELGARTSYSPTTLRQLERVLRFPTGVVDGLLDGTIVPGISPELSTMTVGGDKTALRESRDWLRGYEAPPADEGESMADWNRRRADAAREPVSLLASAVAQLSATTDLDDRGRQALWHAMEALSLLRADAPG